MISFFNGTLNHDFFSHLKTTFKFNKKKKTIIIVPEQNSFYTEKEALKISKILKKEIEVLSFSRLSYKIFQNFGGLTKKIAKKANKLAIVNMTLFQLKNELLTYKFLINKPDFTKLILETIKQIKHNQLNYFQIEKKLQLIKNNSLKTKVNEFWLIFKLYNLKLKSEFVDTTDNLKRANEISSNLNIFEDVQIFFSEFFSFSKLQLKLIETMMKQTDLGFHFYYSDKNHEIFNETFRTINTIKKLAQKNKIEFLTTKIKFKTKKTKTMNLIEKVLINPSLKINETTLAACEKNNNFNFFAATSIFEEVEWLTIKIVEMLRKGHNFSDITILATDLNLYRTTLTSSMEKFKIPFFIDDSISFGTMNLIKCCQNLIEVSSNQKNTINSYINILKSGLTKFSTTEIAIFENYIYIWKIENLNFNKILKMVNSDDDDDEFLQQNLKIVEDIQKTLIHATQTVKNSKNSSKNIAINIIEALKILGIEPNSLGSCQTQTNETFKLEWNSLVSLLETIYESTKNCEIELEQFKFLFKLTAQNLNVKQIQPTLNCVLIGSTDNTIPNKPKTMFILGANELSFPKKCFSNNQLFPDVDLVELKKLELNFGKTLMQQNSLNTIVAHRAVCGATQNLFISYIINQNKTGSTEPCQILKTLKNLFAFSTNTEKENNNFLESCITPQLAIKQLATHFDEKNEKTEALKTFFKTNHNLFKFKNKNNDLESNKKTDFNKKIYSKLEILSPSQIEQFFLCPFSYFCKNILKIKPVSKIEINSKTLGIAFHYMLEKIVSNKNFQNFSSDQLKIEIKNHCERFIEKNLKASSKSTTKFIQTFKNYENILLNLFKYIQKELQNSNFQPSFFEYKIGPESKIGNLKIKLKNKNYVYIAGKIDRIDIKIQNKEKLIRIVDYKTGNKNLSFSDFFHGLNLQMILYAMAIHNADAKLTINAIEYIKILGNLTTYSLNERNPSDEKLKKVKNDGFFKDGLVFLNNSVNNETLMQALPFKLTKNQKISQAVVENKVLTENELELLFNFVKTKIEKMCTLIENFNFKQTQIFENLNLQKSNCSFCPYLEICNPNSVEHISISNIKKTDFFNLIKKETQI